jgi:hypothetical protein
MGTRRSDRAVWSLYLTVGIALANDERREVAIDRVAGLIGWVGAATAALLAVTIELAMQANLHRANFDNGTFMIVFVGYFGFVIVVFFRKMRLLKLPA